VALPSASRSTGLSCNRKSFLNQTSTDIFQSCIFCTYLIH
jgi:hypothetical protein